MLGKRSALASFFFPVDAQGGIVHRTCNFHGLFTLSQTNIKLGKIKTFRELRSSIYFYWF
jgi:hypothetical protein